MNGRIHLLKMQRVSADSH